MNIFEAVEKHSFSRSGYRTNVDRRPENTIRSGHREWLKVGPHSNTVRGDHPIVQEVNRRGIPCNSVCINRRRANSRAPPMGPHRDSRNTGDPPCSYVMHWGSPEGEGALVDELGNRFEEQQASARSDYGQAVQTAAQLNLILKYREHRVKSCPTSNPCQRKRRLFTNKEHIIRSFVLICIINFI